MDRHPGMFTGWMYATWRNDYSELENFAREMVGAACGATDGL